MICSDGFPELSGIEGREIKYLRGPIYTPRVPPRGMGWFLQVGSSQFLGGVSSNGVVSVSRVISSSGVVSVSGGSLQVGLSQFLGVSSP